MKKVYNFFAFLNALGLSLGQLLGNLLGIGVLSFFGGYISLKNVIICCFSTTA